MWFNLAATRFDAQYETEDRDIAVRNRDIVAARMTREQVAEAQRLAREWHEEWHEELDRLMRVLEE